MTDKRKCDDVTRRTALASTVVLPVAVLTGAPCAVAQSAAPVLSPDQRRVLEAFIDRLIPEDELGPGAIKCGTVDYFEVQFAGDLAGEKDSLLEGLASVEAYARRAFGGSFADLSAEKRDAAVTAIQSGDADGFARSGAFFNRVRRLTLEGTFGDPHYGGNRNFAGWDLIKYPGPRLAVAPDQQKMTTIKPLHASAWGDSDGH